MLAEICIDVTALANENREPQRASHGAAQRFPSERIGRRACDQHARCAGSLGDTNNRSDISRILNVVDNEQERLRREHRIAVSRTIDEGGDTAWRPQRAERRHDRRDCGDRIDLRVGQPFEQPDDLEFLRRLGCDGCFPKTQTCRQSVAHQMRTIEQHDLIGFPTRRRSKALDDGVLTAGDSAHAVWYYANSTMKDRLIKKFEDEIAALNHELKLELPKEIKRARELGDLRENAEYQAAKERQRLVEARISMLQKRVSEIALLNVDRIPRDRAGFGSTLHVVEGNGDKLVFQLVMPEDADAQKGLISTTSPIGRAFLNREQGDTVVVATPGGRREFEITKLYTIHDDVAG